jgi:hypothetical protein
VLHAELLGQDVRLERLQRLVRQLRRLASVLRQQLLHAEDGVAGVRRQVHRQRRQRLRRHGHLQQPSLRNRRALLERLLHSLLLGDQVHPSQALRRDHVRVRRRDAVK